VCQIAGNSKNLLIFTAQYVIKMYHARTKFHFNYCVCPGWISNGGIKPPLL
jgi:hypothetical protein